MRKLWKDYQMKIPHADYIIQAGLDKLSSYSDRAEQVPAYVLAMGTLLFVLNRREYLTRSIAINPAMKLTWFSQISATQARNAKKIFLDAVIPPLAISYTFLFGPKHSVLPAPCVLYRRHYRDSSLSTTSFAIQEGSDQRDGAS